MKQRCNNPNHTAARWYHDKGIRICEEWLDFNVFQKWALKNGYKDNLTIDRIDSNKNYCPENCQWIPLKENVSKRNINSEIPRYRVWECKRWYPNEGNKIRIVGVFPYMRDAREEISRQLSNLREKTLSIAIENGESKETIERIKRKESWLRYKYIIEKI